MTVLDHLLSALQKAATYNRHDLTKPSVILWTDGERLWDGVASVIAGARPGFFRLDDSENAGFSGTAAWIRYQLGTWSGPNVPVVYLPGIHKHQFRGAAGFPDNARHLFALQYQGQFFSQSNGKDWTPLAFLASNEQGLGLDIARDHDTTRALSSQLAAILQTPVTTLEGRKVEASDLHDLAVSDPVQSLLQWISAPAATTAAWTPEQRAAFQGKSKSEFGFDAEKDGVLIAAEKLVSAEGKWANAWTRFAEAPATYGGVATALEKVQADDLFGSSNTRLPSVNRKMEDDLRDELKAVGNLPESQARERVLALSTAHAQRTTSVWAKLGQAPLAFAVQHLGRMVHAIAVGLEIQSYASLATSYDHHGWQVDAEARKAWAVTQRSEDLQAVAAALSSTYRPWLQSTAQRLQAIASEYPTKVPQDSPKYQPEAGTILLFVDGLRADVGKELSIRLSLKRYQVKETPCWSPLPTVTATAKPGWREMASRLSGSNPSESFQPSVKANDKFCTAPDFRKLLNELGWALIPAIDCGNPTTAGWTEVGTIDKHGHDLGAQIVRHIDEEISGIEQRIDELLRAGWKVVRVITDHGWLWLPGGLPKIELPKHLTESRWGRCAWPDQQANHKLLQVPWFWGNEHLVVLAPGVGAFVKGQEYAHGGLSIQECLTISLQVQSNDSAETEKVDIKSVKWTGLKLQVDLSSKLDTLRIDIRSKAADAASSVLTSSQREKAPLEGRLTLFVENDSLEGQAAILVVISGSDLLAKKNITIGEN